MDHQQFTLFQYYIGSQLYTMEQQPAKEFKSAFQKIVGHTHFPHFLVYCISYIIMGQVLCCLGPMFPYLAAEEKRLQTQYSFLFTCRALGFISGSMLVRSVGKKFTLHQYIALGNLLQGIFSITFNTTQNLYIKGFYVYMAAIGGSFQDININLSTLECFKGENVAVWLQVIHGCFGIGALIGPFIVYIFQLKTLTVLGFASFVIVIFFYFLQTPEEMSDIKVSINTEQKQIGLPKASIYLISLCFFFAVGQECSYAGWISSYAVLWGFSTKQHATLYSSVFWISCTAFRFIFAFAKGTPSVKIFRLAMVGILTSFFSYIMIFYINSQVGLILMSILYGLSNSVLFPLFLTIPQQFGFKLTQHQGTIFLMWSALGQGCLAVGVGKMMGWFSYNWLIYAAVVLNLALIIANKVNHDLLEKQKQYYTDDNKLQKFISGRVNQSGYNSKNSVQLSSILK